jgi:phosphate transport system substrate-binding protein
VGDSRIRRKLLSILIVTSVINLVGCGSVLGSSPPDEVRIGADAPSAPLAEGLVNAFEGLHPDTPFSLTQDSREALLESVQNGDLVAVILLGSPPDRTVFSTPIALELVVVITDGANPVDSISMDTLRSILTGHITDWSSLDGSSMPIILMTTPDGSSTRLFIESAVLQSKPISSSARIIVDEESLVQWVASTPGALSYIPLSSFTPDVKPLAIDGSTPTLATARRESYPLFAQITFISREQPEEFMRSFLDWIVSAEGQQVVRRYMLGYND